MTICFPWNRNLLICVVAALTARATAASPKYHLSNLGALSGYSYSWANNINQTGTVVGYSSTGSVTHAVSYTNGSLDDLGTLGGKEAEAYDINSTGQVVGRSRIANLDWRGFVYQNGLMSDVGTLGGTYGSATGINNSGQIVGESTLSGGQHHAFLYQNGAMSDLGTLGGSHSYANEINNSGQIVGWSYRTGNGSFHAFLSENGTMIDLGTMGQPDSEALDINDSGQIVGFAGFGNNLYAFLYSDGIMSNLGVLPGLTYSRAYGINNLGQIVGTSYAGLGTFRATIYASGVMSDLNSLVDSSGAGWELMYAFAINDQGWIAGVGTAPSSGSHGFLLVPVPEPSFGSFFAVAGISLLARRRSEG